MELRSDKDGFAGASGLLAIRHDCRERDHDEKISPEPQPCFQSQGSVGCHQGREDDLRTGAAVRPAPEPDQAVGKLLAGVTSLFDNGLKKGKAADVDITALHAKIGQLTLENDFLESALDKAGLLPSARR